MSERSEQFWSALWTRAAAEGVSSMALRFRKDVDRKFPAMLTLSSEGHEVRLSPEAVAAWRMVDPEKMGAKLGDDWKRRFEEHQGKDRLGLWQACAYLFGPLHNPRWKKHTYNPLVELEVAASDAARLCPEVDDDTGWISLNDLAELILSPGEGELPAANVWVEKTVTEGRPDRVTGEHSLGKALWSPQSSKSGANIYRWMTEVRPGDVVFHFTDNAAITGVSIAAGVADKDFVGLKGTDWADAPAYRVPLKSFTKLDPSIHRDEFLAPGPELAAVEMILANNKNLFFSRHHGGLNANQGAYLTPAPAELVELWNRIYQRKTGSPLPLLNLAPMSPPTKAFTKEMAMQGLFMSEAQFDGMLQALAEKKNVVLQGAPGVGKTFVAKRLAYALVGEEDPSRVEMIQFHQSYSYEDFIQGYRPEQSGSFALKLGVFYQFCERAKRDENSNKAYVFIIDEINRGNLSKIFGELMMLMEGDKRGREHAIPLVYSADGTEKFYIPRNVHLVGLMNTADRSLAMVDYALRRRFRFITLRPEFDSPNFKKVLVDAGADDKLVEKIVSRMSDLNEMIAEDSKNLGPGYQVGHSFFCPNGTRPDEAWYRRIVESEIVPLMEEYWLDDESRVKERSKTLLA